MRWTVVLLAMALATGALVSAPASARARDGAAKMAPGQAAAHAALGEAANVPVTPPRFPELASSNGRGAPSGASPGKNAAMAGRAHAEARKHAGEDSRAARIEGANRAAEPAVAAAVGNANADAHAAAGQARAAAAKANAAAHTHGPPAGARP